MNAMQQAERAYSDNVAPIKSDSQIEYDSFARVSRALKTAEDNKKNNYSGFVKALDQNRHLWRLLAVDVADKNNALPQSLRAQIFYLAEFTAAHTTRILHEDASIDPLADINLAVMRGLKNKGVLS